LIDQIHHDENIVVDPLLVVVVKVIVIETEIVFVVQLSVQSMDNIIHNNQDMFSPHMYDDG
jgi:hypothetical protein